MSSSSSSDPELEKFRTGMAKRENDIKSEDSNVWLSEIRIFINLMNNVRECRNNYSAPQLSLFFTKMPGIVKEVVSKSCKNDDAVETVETFLCAAAQLCSSFLLDREPIDGVPATLAILFNPSNNFYQKYGFTSAASISTGSSSSGGGSANGHRQARTLWLKEQPVGSWLNFFESKNSSDPAMCEVLSNDLTNIMITNMNSNKTQTYVIEDNWEKFRPMDDSSNIFSDVGTSAAGGAAGGAPVVDKDTTVYLKDSDPNPEERRWRSNLQQGNRVDVQNIDDQWYMALVLDKKQCFLSNDGKNYDIATADLSEIYIPETATFTDYLRIAFVGLPESSDIWINSNSSILAPFMTMSKGRRGENPVREEVNALILPIYKSAIPESSPSGETVLLYPNGFFSKCLEKVVANFYMISRQEDLFQFVTSIQDLNLSLSIFSIIGLTAPLLLTVRDSVVCKTLIQSVMRRIIGMTEQEVRSIKKEMLDSSLKALEAITLRTFNYEKTGNKFGKIIESTQLAMATHYLKCDSIQKKSEGLQMYIDLLKKGANCSFEGGIQKTSQQSNSTGTPLAVQASSLGLDAMSYKVVMKLYDYTYVGLAQEIVKRRLIPQIILDGSIHQLHYKISELLSHLIITQTIDASILDALWNAFAVSNVEEAVMCLNKIIPLLSPNLIYYMLDLVSTNPFYSPILFSVFNRLRDMFYKEQIEYSRDENLFLNPSSVLSDEQSRLIENQSKCFKCVIQIANHLSESKEDNFYKSFTDFFSFGHNVEYSPNICQNHIFRCQFIIRDAVEKLLHESKNNLLATNILSSYVSSWSIFEKVVDIPDVFRKCYIVDELNAKYKLIEQLCDTLVNSKIEFSTYVSQFTEVWRCGLGSEANTSSDEFIFDSSYQNALKEKSFYQMYVKNFSKITKFFTLMVKNGNRINIEQTQIQKIWDQIVLQAIMKNEVYDILQIFVLEKTTQTTDSNSSDTSSGSPTTTSTVSPFLSLDDLKLVLSLASKDTFLSSRVFLSASLKPLQRVFQLVNNLSLHSRGGGSEGGDDKGAEKWAIISHPSLLVHWDIFLRVVISCCEKSVADLATQFVTSLCGKISYQEDKLDDIFWLRYELVNFTMAELRKVSIEMDEVKFRRLIFLLEAILKEASFDSRNLIRSHSFKNDAAYVHFAFSLKGAKYGFPLLKSSSIGDLIEKICLEIKLKTSEFKIAMKAAMYVYTKDSRLLLRDLNLSDRENITIVVNPSDQKKEPPTSEPLPVETSFAPRINVDPSKLPANMISQNEEYMDLLFALLENNTNSDNLWSLISKLPTIHSLYFSWLNLSSDSGDEPMTPGTAKAYRDSAVLLKSFCKKSISLSSNNSLSKRIKSTNEDQADNISLIKLTYNLQILEYLIEPVKNKEQWQSLQQLFDGDELALLQTWPARLMDCNGYACISWAYKQCCALLESNVKMSNESYTSFSDVDTVKFLDKRLMSCIKLSSKILSGMFCHKSRFLSSLSDKNDKESMSSSLVYCLTNVDSGNTYVASPIPLNASRSASAAGGGPDESPSKSDGVASNGPQVEEERVISYDDIFGWSFTKDDLSDDKINLNLSDNQELFRVSLKALSLLRLFSRFSPHFRGKCEKNTVNLFANVPYNNLMNSIKNVFMIFGIMSTMNPTLIQNSCQGGGSSDNDDITMLIKNGVVGYSLSGADSSSTSTSETLSPLEKDMSILISESVIAFLRVIEKSDQNAFVDVLNVVRAKVIGYCLETIDSLLYNQNQTLTFTSLSNIFETLCKNSNAPTSPEIELVFNAGIVSVFPHSLVDRRRTVAITLFENILSVFRSPSSSSKVNWGNFGLCTKFLTIFATQDKSILTHLSEAGYDIQKIVLEEFLGLEPYEDLNKCLIDTFARNDANIIRSNLYDLLLESAGSDINLNMKAFFYLHSVHKTAVVNNDKNVLDPADDMRKYGYVGLKNFGCTCYMNSLLQVLFSIPDVQNNILSLSTSSHELSMRPEIDVRNDYILQLQKLFMYLKYSSKRDYVMEDWIFCFKDMDLGLEPISKSIQQDAQEFLGKLCERVERSISDRNERVAARSQIPQPPLWDRNLFMAPFEGKICEQFYRIEGDNHLEITANMQKYRQTPQPYTSISLAVQGNANIAESLQSMMKGEFIPEFGDDKIPVVKRQCILKLSDTIIFHLKRFEINFTTWESYKVNDKFSFPLELDMFPYTTDCLDNLNGARSVDHTEYIYTLHGVVVHQGDSLNSGHYYSFIKCPVVNDSIIDSKSSSDSDKKFQWLEFNDHTVSPAFGNPFDIKNLEAECFGGYTDNEMISRGAYLLVYKRIPKTKSANAINSSGNIPTVESDSDDDVPPPMTLIHEKQDEYVLVEKSELSSVGSDGGFIDLGAELGSNVDKKASTKEETPVDHDSIKIDLEDSTAAVLAVAVKVQQERSLIDDKNAAVAEASLTEENAPNKLLDSSNTSNFILDSFEDKNFRIIEKENISLLLNCRIFCLPHVAFFRKLASKIFKHVDDHVFIHQKSIFPWQPIRRADNFQPEDFYADFVTNFMKDAFKLCSKSCHLSEVTNIYSLINNMLERLNLNFSYTDETILLKRAIVMSIEQPSAAHPESRAEDTRWSLNLVPSVVHPSKGIIAFLMANFDDIFMRNIYFDVENVRESFSNVMIALFMSLFTIENPLIQRDDQKRDGLSFSISSWTTNNHNLENNADFKKLRYDEDTLGPAAVPVSALDEDAMLEKALQMSLMASNSASSAAGGGNVGDVSSATPPLFDNLATENSYVREHNLSELFVKMITSNTCFQMIPVNWKRSTAFTKLLAALVDKKINKIGCLVVAIAYCKRLAIAQIVDIIMGDKSPLRACSPAPYDVKSRKKCYISSFETVFKTGPGDNEFNTKGIGDKLPDWSNLLKTLNEILTINGSLAYDDSNFSKNYFEGRFPRIYLIAKSSNYCRDAILNKQFLSTLLKQCRYNQHSAFLLATLAAVKQNQTLVYEVVFESLQQQQVESLINVFHTIDFFIFKDTDRQRDRFTYFIPPARRGGGGGILADYLFGLREQPLKAKTVTASLISVLHIWNKLCSQSSGGDHFINDLRNNLREWAPWIIKFCFRYSGKLEREVVSDLPSYIEILGLEDLKVASWALRVARLQEMVSALLTKIRTAETVETLIPEDTFADPNPFNAESSSSNYVDLRNIPDDITDYSMYV